MSRTISWFSCGAASAVATKRTLENVPDALVVYCETNGEHPDNERFLADCEAWFGKTVTRISSEKFSSTWDVWTRERYLSGIAGASCSRALKFRPRLEFQLPDDIHVFGYTADGNDKRRADNFRNNHPELIVKTPLIEKGVKKAGTLAMIQNAGIKLPVMYGLGFHMNNCIPCVKAQGASYWALIRQEFPAEFERMVILSRSLKVRLCKLGTGERIFIDEIPADQPTTNPIQPACDFMCASMEAEMAE